jgi:hypothetical protein
MKDIIKHFKFVLLLVPDMAQNEETVHDIESNVNCEGENFSAIESSDSDNEISYIQESYFKGHTMNKV